MPYVTRRSSTNGRRGAALEPDPWGNFAPDDDDGDDLLFPAGVPRWRVPGGVIGLPPGLWPRLRERPRVFMALRQMLRRVRPVGTLRGGWPVYRGQSGGRYWRVVARPRGQGELEIAALHAEAEGELFPVTPAPLQARGAWKGRIPRWRLRLGGRGLHTILARLEPRQLRMLAGGVLPADPMPAVVAAVGTLARRARPAGRLSGGFTVFATPGWRLLVRPLGELEGEIVAIAPVVARAPGTVAG